MSAGSLDTGKGSAGRRERALLAVFTALAYACYFVHLRADFPNGSPWNDWAKFTDEGWYGGAALHHAWTGHWYVPNGFNPAVGLPAWPLLLAGWFAVWGPGMAAARAIAVLLLGGSLLLMVRLLRPHCGIVIALAAAALVLIDPFVFAFHRLAILEPLIVFLLMFALWCAGVVGRSQHANRGRAMAVAMVCGAALAAMVLTKTTAAVLAPAMLYQMWATAVLPGWMREVGRQSKPGDDVSLRVTSHVTMTAKLSTALALTLRRAWRDRAAFWPPAVAAGTAVLLWGAWFLLWVRPRYLADYRELFAINNGHAHGRILLQVMAHALGDATWIQVILVPMALLVIAASFRFLRELWRIPIFGASVLALAGDIGFIGWHTWFQPRYYLVCVLPFATVLALGARAVELRVHSAPARPWKAARRTAQFAIGIAAAVMLVQTAGYLLHPRYTMLSAAQSISSAMKADPQRRPVLLAGSGDDFSLLAGIRSVNPEWPLGGLDVLVKQEQPGWYAAYTPWEDKHVDEMRTLYHLHRMATYTVLDDPDHRALVLYQVDAR